MSEKINFDNLKEACQSMIQLIDQQDEGAGTTSWHFQFHHVANEIRYELDGSQSCVPEVRNRALDHQDA